MSTAAGAVGAWSGNWWGGNLKGVWYFTQQVRTPVVAVGMWVWVFVEGGGVRCTRAGAAPRPLAAPTCPSPSAVTMVLVGRGGNSPTGCSSRTCRHSYRPEQGGGGVFPRALLHPWCARTRRAGGHEPMRMNTFPRMPACACLLAVSCAAVVPFRHRFHGEGRQRGRHQRHDLRPI
jgi:hypothetical protein